MDVDPPVPHAQALPADVITLNVSGAPIRTAKSTLRASPYFRSLLERWEEGIETLPDGSVFIDADPEIFRIILTYMRRPTVFPLFWTREKGFDHVLYNKIMAEADFYMLEELRDWIRNKQYLYAVLTEFKTEIKAADESEWKQSPFQKDDKGAEHVEHVELISCTPIALENLGSYSCPKNIYFHKSPEDCAYQDYENNPCFDPSMLEEPSWIPPRKKIPQSIVCIWKLTKVDLGVCFRG